MASIASAKTQTAPTRASATSRSGPDDSNEVSSTYTVMTTCRWKLAARSSHSMSSSRSSMVA
eukprot:11939885-Heterocapsa_arctica.AAC.1